MNIVELELDETLADFEIQDWIDNVFSVQFPEIKAKIKHGCSGICNKDKWHNLEENPDDLPKENMKQVIVKLSDGSYEMGWYCIHNKSWWTNDCPDYDEELTYYDYNTGEKIYPIKWKEIE